MKDAAGPPGAEPMAVKQDQRIADVVAQQQSRLLQFIRRRVPDPLDAEDILQDVFSELVEANRLLMPIDHVGAWLFRRDREAAQPGGFGVGVVAGGSQVRLDRAVPVVEEQLAPFRFGDHDGEFAARDVAGEARRRPLHVAEQIPVLVVRRVAEGGGARQPVRHLPRAVRRLYRPGGPG